MPVLKCALCREKPREPGGFYCPGCAAQQQRAAAVAKRVTSGRKVRSLTATELRGVGVYRPSTK